MHYEKKDAVMTRGLAILSMIILHLFCRLGDDIVYTPWIWLSKDKPLIYWFGFFSEICVPLYSLCAGYAQYLLYKKQKTTLKNNINRIGRLLINYWIILVLFCLLGLIFDHEGKIPGSTIYFLQSIVLVHSYNGAWWYLNTYIIILLIPTALVMLPIEKVNFYLGVVGCFVLDFGWYLVVRFELVPIIPEQMEIFSFVEKEICNLIAVLPYFWIGAYLCKIDVFDKISNYIRKNISKRMMNYLIGGGLGLLFILTNIVEKAVFLGPVAVLIFLGFNLLHKPIWVERIFAFLGKHSTNIWLTHMFFYAVLFKDLVWKAKYPIFIIAFMLFLCISTSYLVMWIQKLVKKIARIPLFIRR